MQHHDKQPGSVHWLNATQACGALNDNLFKFFLIFVLIEAYGDKNSSLVMATIGIVFTLPFLLFNPIAGRWADRYSKGVICRHSKTAEVLIMTAAIPCFIFDLPNLLLLLFFLLATQSAIFGPSKFGILPELVDEDRLVPANGQLQAFTFLAIIIGTVLAPLLSEQSNRDMRVFAGACFLVSLTGWAVSRNIPRTVPLGRVSKTKVIHEIRLALRAARRVSGLTACIWGAAYFLFVAGFIQLYIIPYGTCILGLTDEQSAYLFVAAALGIGLGSFLAGTFGGVNSGRKLIPAGYSLMVFGYALLAVSPGITWLAVCWVLMLAIGGGLVVVPVQAYIQTLSPARQRGRILAANSFFSFAGALLAAIIILALGLVDANPRVGMALMSAITVPVVLVLRKQLAVIHIQSDETGV